MLDLAKIILECICFRNTNFKEELDSGKKLTSNPHPSNCVQRFLHIIIILPQKDQILKIFRISLDIL